MTVYNIPYNPQTDPKALFAQGLKNYLGGLNQQLESKRFGKALTESDSPALQELGQLVLRGRMPPQQAIAMSSFMQKSTPTIEQLRARRAVETGAEPGTEEFESIAEGRQTPESESQFTAYLGRKIANGTATEEDKIIFGQLTKVPSTSITVNTGDVEKATKTQLEKDVIELQSTLGELKAIEQQFEPDFFTYRGKGQTFFTGLAEKLEVPMPQAATDFLKRRTKFFADSKRVFLKFRKFITGVAGGIEEFREIAKATIDPESDSPTEFQAKFASMRDNAVRVSNLLLAIRNSGLDASDESIIKSALDLVPLQKVPLDINQNATLESLSGQQGIIPDDIRSMTNEELRRLAGIE